MRTRKVIAFVLAACMAFSGFLTLGSVNSYAAAKKPGKATIKSIKTTDTWAVMKWKKVSNAKGYEVYVKASGETSFRKIATVTKKPNKKGYVTYKYKKLKSGQKYSFRIRAYNKSGKKRVYGKYSSVKEKKTKDLENIRKNVYAGFKKYCEKECPDIYGKDWYFQWKMNDDLNWAAQEGAKGNANARNKVRYTDSIRVENYFGNGSDIMKYVDDKFGFLTLCNSDKNEGYKTLGVGYGHDGYLVVFISEDWDPRN
jgi:hypothetical protein